MVPTPRLRVGLVFPSAQGRPQRREEFHAAILHVCASNHQLPFVLYFVADFDNPTLYGKIVQC